MHCTTVGQQQAFMKYEDKRTFPEICQSFVSAAVSGFTTAGHAPNWAGPRDAMSAAIQLLVSQPCDKTTSMSKGCIIGCVS